ncbi:NADH-quinone oxidoreductase subunit E [Xinfangfangia sp. CPCC 101601]|uniref:NADH-quinone oxidoreductase subunit E n=1 Tax=Pseudogemmobacter lacusdianii TaxID=3069608 RepID=A0ABU0W0P2_9RHOB|nr:NADH-quinone oxidoreductase subunit E [Xinfangfangia sp. CPCC 101601]MDQ2066675.1 NADH-quinone oxidoreductase subunit E [Xinfangfangia sp. CPCC 101601]
MLRRLHPVQPDSFAFTPANLAWAEGQIAKYPAGRQASAVIPLLWRAQEQEGWLSRPAIENVANLLGLAYIRVLEVATFYFMFQLQPVGSVANIQICGTTSCMICGAEDLIAVCKELIAPAPHTLSADGKFSWEEVECLGACANAPMAMIGKDYYEDLTPEKLRQLIARFTTGEVPVPGSQIGRYSSEPAAGLTSLQAHAEGRVERNASVGLALSIGDTVKRIDGTEVPLSTPWIAKPETPKAAKPTAAVRKAEKGLDPALGEALSAGKPETDATAPAGVAVAAPGQNTATGDAKPAAALDARQLAAPRAGAGDDLKKIEGIGPVAEKLLNDNGVFHFDQIAGWSEEDVAFFDAKMDRFKGRITRDRWVAQAKIIVTEGLERFLERARSNDY